MHVERITEDNGDWIYLNREIVEAANDGRYKQRVVARTSTGEVTYYPWMKYNFTEVTTT